MATTLIAGANRGIGLALAQRSLERGDEVIAVCRQSNEELDRSGAHVVPGVDVTDAQALASLARSLAGKRIDRLLLNAGVMTREALGGIDESAFDDMRRQFEINSLGPLRVAQALLGNLGEGSKVGILTSRMGSVADNGSGGYYGYRASKAAVNAIGKSLAVDLQPRGIAIFLFHPGYVATDMVGGKGDLSPLQSAGMLLERLEGLGLAQTGSFWHANGSELPW
ncbi:SDR family oxidoreductase [Arenimonas sp.]|uniref:SDR family oxidoreductase n=1 Tax=Arenimonas sp. TaxID=1872635 RepID=UPI0039E398F7